MCGIAGIFGWKGDRLTLEERLSRMQRALAHRGPDDEGIWTSRNGSSGLCHTRLSILDLSPAGHQPMGIPQLEIAFNGEIYNYKELRDAMERDGVHFTSHGDTEVILRSYAQKKEKCLESFDGMFAFGIYDEEIREGLLARDPFGIKPLYYHFSKGQLIFASELRALLASGLVERRLSQRAVDSFLRCGSVQEPLALIDGVETLPAGSFLKYTANGIRVSQFAEINFPETRNTADAIEVAREAFQKTIRRHLVSDVPVGLFLSGGIDSSCIASEVMRQAQGSLHSFSIGVDDDGLNEAPVARRFAEELGTHHHEYLLREEDVPPLFQEYLAALDQPSIDGFNTFCVSRFARQNGAKVVLSGLGGDEIFGGYGSFSRVPKLWETSKRLSVINPLQKIAGKILENTFSDSKACRTGEWLQRPPSLEASYHLVRSIFSQRQSSQIQQAAGWKNRAMWETQAPPNFASVKDRISYLELTRYMRNQLLKDSDVMSMAHGLELRVPLVDWEFFRSISAIPDEARYASGKNLLVEAAGGLPEWIAGQPKRGFLFPFAKWTKRLWKTRHLATLNITPQEDWPWYHRWAVNTLDDWMLRHKVSL